MSRVVWLILVVTSYLCASGQDLSTLATVQGRGELFCGVSDLSPDEIIQTEDGGLVGFYADFCRALAVAVLDDAASVVYLPLSPSEQFSALRRGEMDIVVGSVTLTSDRDAEVAFGPVVFHEGAQHYAPALRQGDERWRDTVSWVIYALIQAEEWGLTSQNVADAAQVAGEAPALERFLGMESALVEQLGLEPAALQRTLGVVGNYGEIYERHLGVGASLTLDRGPNRLWTEGGLLYAPPFSLR